MGGKKWTQTCGSAEVPYLIQVPLAFNSGSMNAAFLIPGAPPALKCDSEDVVAPWTIPFGFHGGHIYDQCDRL